MSQPYTAPTSARIALPPEGRRPRPRHRLLFRRARLRHYPALWLPRGLSRSGRLSPPHRPQHLGKRRRHPAASGPQPASTTPPFSTPHAPTSAPPSGRCRRGHPLDGAADHGVSERLPPRPRWQRRGALCRQAAGRLAARPGRQSRHGQRAARRRRPRGARRLNARTSPPCHLRLSSSVRPVPAVAETGRPPGHSRHHPTGGCARLSPPGVRRRGPCSPANSLRRHGDRRNTMATGTNIRTPWFEGRWHDGDAMIMRAADHAPGSAPRSSTARAPSAASAQTSRPTAPASTAPPRR